MRSALRFFRTAALRTRISAPRSFAMSSLAVSKHTRTSITTLESQLSYLENAATNNALSASPTAPHERDCRFEELLRDAVKSSLGDAELPWRVYTMFRKHGKPSAWTYRHMLVYCLDAGHMMRFDQVHADMLDDGVIPDVSVINVLLARCLLHKIPLQPVLDEATINNITANRDTYLLLLQAYAKDGLVQNCIDVLQQMAQRSLPLEPDDDVFCLIAQAARNSDDMSTSIIKAAKAARKLGFPDVSWHQFGLPKRLLREIARH